MEKKKIRKNIVFHVLKKHKHKKSHFFKKKEKKIQE